MMDGTESDIGLEKGLSKTPDWLKTDYDDYLRLLCTKSNNVKVLRLLDLVLPIHGQYDMSSGGGNQGGATLKFKGLGYRKSFYVEAEDSY